MGWLSKLMTFGGIVAAPFTGGASLSITAAGMQMEGAEKAAKAQKEAADQALAFEKQVYEQTRADLAPYRNVGAEAMTTLGAAMGLGGGGGGGPTATQPEAVPKTSATNKSWWSKDSIKERAQRGLEKRNEVIERLDRDKSGKITFGDLVRGPAAGTKLGDVIQQHQARQQSASGYSRMRSPEGDEGDVPNDLAPHYEEQGARYV